VGGGKGGRMLFGQEVKLRHWEGQIKPNQSLSQANQLINQQIKQNQSMNRANQSTNQSDGRPGVGG
jgi:hypothetical protein